MPSWRRRDQFDGAIMATKTGMPGPTVDIFPNESYTVAINDEPARRIYPMFVCPPSLLGHSMSA